MDEHQEYPISYLAYLFPDMTEAQFERLVKSIQANGLRVPITVWRGEIIDGRHRYAACLRAGVEPRFEYLDDDEDPVQFVLDKNGEARVLDTSGRAVVGYKLSSMSKPGRPVDSRDEEPQMTQGEAALRLGVSRRSVTNVGRVLAEDSAAISTLRQAVASGRVKVSDAAKAGRPAGRGPGAGPGTGARRRVQDYRQRGPADSKRVDGSCGRGGARVKPGQGY